MAANKESDDCAEVCAAIRGAGEGLFGLFCFLLVLVVFGGFALVVLGTIVSVFR